MSKGDLALPTRVVRQRPSHVPKWQLTAMQLRNNWAALGHAQRLGLRPNVSLDIHFDRGGLDDPTRNAGASLQAFLKSARQWIERRGGETAIIWVMENRSGFGGEGVHAHVIMHVPDDLMKRWHELKPRWARKAGLSMAKGGVVNFEPVRSWDGAKGKLAYMSKDAPPKMLAVFEPFINPRTGKPWLHNSGKPSNVPIYGLKAGVSRNLGLAARTSYRHHQG